MQRYKNILMAIALDKRDRTTIEHAAYFAKAAQSREVCLAHISRNLDIPDDLVEEHQDLLEPSEEMLTDQLHHLMESNAGLFPQDIQIDYVIRQGSWTPELVRLASAKQSDLICLTRYPDQPHDLLSAAAVNLMQKSPCSVFIPPHGVAPQYHRILVPIDFSEHTPEVLDVSFAIAESTPHAQVTVLHVNSVPLGYHKAGSSYEEFAAKLQKHSEKDWQQLLPQINTRNIPYQVRYETNDNIPAAIHEVAEDINADLLVVASHGRTGMAGMLLGHVVDSLFIQTRRPFLCVKKKGQVVNFLHALLQLYGFE